MIPDGRSAEDHKIALEATEVETICIKATTAWSPCSLESAREGLRTLILLGITEVR
jgi:hypothetical protein